VKVCHRIIRVLYFRRAMFLFGVISISGIADLSRAGVHFLLGEQRYKARSIVSPIRKNGESGLFYLLRIPYAALSELQEQTALKVAATDENGAEFQTSLRFGSGKEKVKKAKEKRLVSCNLRLRVMPDENNEAVVFAGKLYEITSDGLAEPTYTTTRLGKELGQYSAREVNQVYNRLLRFLNHTLYAKVRKRSAVISGLVFEKDEFEIFRYTKLFFELGGKEYLPFIFSLPFFGKKQRAFFYAVKIPCADIMHLGLHTKLNVCYTHENGMGMLRGLTYSMLDLKKVHYRSTHPKHFKASNSAILFRQGNNNLIYVSHRVINVTDRFRENLKLNLACYIAPLWKKRNISLFYEKEARKYEESAAVLFEKLIERGYRNIYFVIDEDSPHCARIPKSVLNNVVAKYSFRHYLYFFAARNIIGTEAVAHVLELRVRNKLAAKRIYGNQFGHLFLQHGVTYMLALDGPERNAFNKNENGSFPKKGKVVVSSRAEAAHFVEAAGFGDEDLYVSGIPKFDSARQDKDSDKIVIMPTWRPWDYNLVRVNPTQSSYYKFAENILAQIPQEYLQHVLFLPHPLFRDTIGETALTPYIPKDFIYDEVLRKTRLLITDYSSISYDAFYRGANVIFCWEDKDYCLECYKNTLLLSEEKAFGDISRDFSDLGELIRKNYNVGQQELHLQRYRHIVEFYDGKNTERLIGMIEADGLLHMPE